MEAKGDPAGGEERLTVVWYLALLMGFEAVSATCTARALAVCPFAYAVACWELFAGVLCALPFWVVGSRSVPTARCLPGGALGVAAALALSCVAATMAADARGAPAPYAVDVSSVYRVVDASRRDAMAAWAYYSGHREGLPPKASTVDLSDGPLAAFDRVGPREHQGRKGVIQRRFNVGFFRSDFKEESIHALRSPREMIARPKLDMSHPFPAQASTSPRRARRS